MKLKTNKTFRKGLIKKLLIKRIRTKLKYIYIYIYIYDKLGLNDEVKNK